MTPDIAHLSGLKEETVRNAIKRLRAGENIHSTTKRRIFEGVNKREGGGLVMSDIIWSK